MFTFTYHDYKFLIFIQLFCYFIGEPKIKSEFLNPCLNGGYFTELEKCICLPGFKGKFCETGN